VTGVGRNGAGASLVWTPAGGSTHRDEQGRLAFLVMSYRLWVGSIRRAYRSS